MILFGNKNPYLRGTRPTQHINPAFRPQEDPFAGLSDEERAKAVAKVGAKARDDFIAHIAKIQEIIATVNPFQLLAHFGYYDQIWFEGSPTADPYKPILQSGMEWLQALVLQRTEDELKAALDTLPSQEILISANETLHAMQQAYGFMRFGAKREAPLVALITESVRQHTAWVRNEGFPAQTERLMRELFHPLDQEFKIREGYSLSALTDVLSALRAMVVQRLNRDLAQRKEIFGGTTSDQAIATFCGIHGLSIDDIRRGMQSYLRDERQVKQAIQLWLDEKNFRFFYFTEAEFQKVLPAGIPPALCQRILDALSLGWGQLASHNPEHLILHNPVWTKPLIAVGNQSYFLPIPSLIQSFGLEMIESSLRLHADLWERYGNQVRGDYLENRTEAALRGAFPGAKVLRGLRWKSEADAKEWENDILVLLDTHALVFECKSGRLRDRASRGDAAALKDEIGKLVGEPAQQGRRFAEFLVAQKSTIKLQDASHHWHELDLSQLLRASTVTVLLDCVGPLATQKRLLCESGLLLASSAPTATLTLHDLECVLEILEGPAMACHYFRRRAEIESSNEIIGDELGLLGMYLATGFDLGEAEDKNHRFAIPGLGDELVPFFMGKEIGAPTPKPRRRFRAWWLSMLTRFQKENFFGWIEASYALLAVNYHRQNEFEKQCKRLVRIVRSNWHRPHDNTCTMLVGSKERRIAIACIVIKNKSKPEAYKLINDRIEQAETELGAVCVLAICVSAGERADPYLGVYFHTANLEKKVSADRLISLAPSS